MNVYDMALRHFTDINSMRDFAHEPFCQGGHVYATDSYIAIQIRKELVGDEYKALEFPNISRLFRYEKNRDVVIALEDLNGLYESIPDVSFEECDACGGTGKVDYEFEHYGEKFYRRWDCPVCNGKGSVDSSITKKDYRYGIKFEENNLVVRQTHLVILIKTMRRLGIESAVMEFTDT